MHKRLLIAALALCALLSACGMPAPVQETAPALTPLAPLQTPADPEGYEAIPVYFNDVLIARGYKRSGFCYVPLSPFCARAGVGMTWTGDSKSFSLYLDELHIEGRSGREYLTASWRYIYAPEGWMTLGEEFFLPEQAVCRIFDIKSEYGGDELRFTGKKMHLFEGGVDFYDLNIPQEHVYWLSHIISAEARGESLKGQIAVGNVVMNRVKSDLFPDSVFEVIYDTEHAIQFEPIALGSILEEPTQQALIAAYLALEGTDIVGDCLYFVNPKYAGAWFDASLDLVAQIGSHNFYARKD